MVHGGLPRQHYLEVYWPCAGGLSVVNSLYHNFKRAASRHPLLRLPDTPQSHLMPCSVPLSTSIAKPNFSPVTRTYKRLGKINQGSVFKNQDGLQGEVRSIHVQVVQRSPEHRLLARFLPRPPGARRFRLLDEVGRPQLRSHSCASSNVGSTHPSTRWRRTIPQSHCRGVPQIYPV